MISGTMSDFLKTNFNSTWSGNFWKNLLFHASIGLLVGVIIMIVRGVAVAPVLCAASTTAWGMRNYFRKQSMR
jgi:hypothetical protein